MNFFKSILLDDEDPPKAENPHESGSDSDLKSPQGDSNEREAAQGGNAADAWSFGGFMKTLATRSESVIETYRRDLQEFGSGLRKETETIREVASRAVKDLPASLEAGTSAAHGVLDGVLKSTADIISKEAQLFGSDGETEAPESNRGANPGRYSWFEAQLNAIQSDPNTFCEEPEDADDYEKWKLGYHKRDEIGDLVGENGVLEGVYRKFVPGLIDDETFWCRYFYRVDKLKQQEQIRANLVKRAITVDDDEDYSWDVDDDEKDDGNGNESASAEKAKGGEGNEDMEVIVGNLNPAQKLDGSKDRPDGKESSEVNENHGGKNIESSNTVRGEMPLNGTEVKAADVVAVGKTDNEVKVEESVKNSANMVEEKGEPSANSEKSEVPVVSNQQTRIEEEEEEEEDLGWDEIEDIGSGEENKISTTTTRGERPNRADLRKQLNTADEDEDLSWDIEDDEEPVKS